MLYCQKGLIISNMKLIQQVAGTNGNVYTLSISFNIWKQPAI